MDSEVFVLPDIKNERLTLTIEGRVCDVVSKSKGRGFRLYKPLSPFTLSKQIPPQPDSRTRDANERLQDIQAPIGYNFDVDFVRDNKTYRLLFTVVRIETSAEGVKR